METELACNCGWIGNYQDLITIGDDEVCPECLTNEGLIDIE